MKMSDVIELPVKTEMDRGREHMIDGNGYVICTDLEIRAAAHAINCHDELVASLRRVLGSKDWGNIAEHSDNCKCVYHESVAALNKAQGRNEAEVE